MKCPKCGYLGFESVDRCRNCGYDFSLSPTADILELPLRPTAAMSANPERPQPLDDLSFLDVTALLNPFVFRTSEQPEGSRSGRAPAFISADLPLFGAAIPDDVPLITRPSPPRPPACRASRHARRAAAAKRIGAGGARWIWDLEPPACTWRPVSRIARLNDAGRAGERCRTGRHDRRQVRGVSDRR